MYYFKNKAGDTLKLHFAHKGGKKGTVEKPGKAPKFTVCKIIDDENNVISTGLASPVKEVAEIVPFDVPADQVPLMYGNRLLRTVKATDGSLIALLRGDSFSRKRGRYESARKALRTSGLGKETRKSAVYSLLGMLEVIDDDTVINLEDIVEDTDGC